MPILYQNGYSIQDHRLTDILIDDDGIIAACGDHLPADGIETVNLNGRIISPPFIDSHIHLDYVYTALPGSQTGTLFSAIDQWAEQKASFTQEDYKRNALKAVKKQMAHGVQLIRTHVDVTDPTFRGLHALLELKEELRGIVDLQIIAFPQEGYYAYKGGADLVEEALRQGADVVGGIPHFEFTREEGLKSIETGFKLAAKYDRPIDFHCDETDDDQSRFSEAMAALAYHTGMGSRVSLSHTCAMGSYNNAYAFKMMTKYRQSGVNFVFCPTENTYLQSRFDSPRRRGITRVAELLKNDINVSLGQDSICDPWYPLGSGDLIHQVDYALHLGQMIDPERIEHAFDLITFNAARTAGLKDYGLKPGLPASFVVVDARSMHEALCDLPPVILSVRRGRVLMQKQPAQLKESVL